MQPQAEGPGARRPWMGRGEVKSEVLEALTPLMPEVAPPTALASAEGEQLLPRETEQQPYA